MSYKVVHTHTLLRKHQYTHNPVQQLYYSFLRFCLSWAITPIFVPIMSSPQSPVVDITPPALMPVSDLNSRPTND